MMEQPKTAQEFREGVSRASFGAEIMNVAIARSPSSVHSSMRRGVDQCLNRTVTTTSSTPGPYGPQVSRVTTQYSTSYRVSGGKGELAMYSKVLGSAFLGLPQPEGMRYVVDVVPAAGGTRLDIYGGKWGDNKLDAAVVSWAKGGAIRCPKLN